MKKFFIVSINLITVFLTACTSSEQTQTDQKKQEIYVFDDVEKIDTLQNRTNEQVQDSISISEPSQKDSVININISTDTLSNSVKQEYIVQVGAFSTRERAEQFIQENKVKSKYELILSFSEKVHLHVVQLNPFPTKEEAEAARNELWEIPIFKGAFIITKELK